MQPSDERIDTIYTILADFEHTMLLSFFADLCYLRGWQSRLTVGESDTVGDLLLRQTIPSPRRVAVANHDEPLTREALEEYVDAFLIGSADELTIIAHTEPADDALALANEHGIAIIGLGDLAQETAIIGGLDVLASYVEEDEELAAKHGSRLSGLGQSGSQGSSASRQPTTGEAGIDNQFFQLELLGYEFVDPAAADTTGILVALEVASKRDDLRIKPDEFTFHAADGFTYTAAKPGRHGDATEAFLHALQEELSSEWASDKFIKVSAGGRLRFVLYFECSEAKTLQKLRYRVDMLGELLDITDEQIEANYGIPKHSNSSDELGSWEPFSSEMVIDETQQDEYRELPEAVRTAVESL